MIQNTAEFEETRGFPAYVTIETGQPEAPYQSEWAQQDVFLAEAYGDYLCKQGGMEELLKELEKDTSGHNDYLLFTTEVYYQTAVLPLLEEKNIPSQIIAAKEAYIAVRVK